MQWILKKFHDLTVDEFHDILQLRINIFVVEQNCPYPELDDRDKIAFHFFGINKENKIIAYTRIFKPGDYYEEPAFGRVAVHQDYRNQKIGFQLVEQTIIEIHKLFGNINIKIGAQTYLNNFYQSFGFHQVGDDYIEDGIPHIHMLINKPSNNE